MSGTRVGGTSDSHNASYKVEAENEKLGRIADLKEAQVRLQRLSSEDLPTQSIDVKQSVLSPHIKKTLLKNNSSKHKFTCDICAKSLACYSSFYNHMRFMHQNPNSFKCSQCHRSFNYKYLLVAHIERHHEGISLYNCDNCDFRSNLKDPFRNHIATCSAENDVPKVSRMSFGNPSKPIKLVNGAKKRKGSSPTELTCPICKATCRGRSELFIHLKSHSEDSCELPNEGLINSQKQDSMHGLCHSDSHRIPEGKVKKCSEGDLTNGANKDRTTLNKLVEGDDKIGREIVKQTQKFSERIKNRKPRKASCSCCADDHDQMRVKAKASASETSLGNIQTGKRGKKDSLEVNYDLKPIVRLKRITNAQILNISLQRAFISNDEITKLQNLLKSDLTHPLNEEFKTKSKNVEITKSVIKIEAEPKDDVRQFSTDNVLPENASSKIKTELSAYKCRVKKRLSHRKSETGRRLSFACKHCDKIFSRKIYVINHLRWSHNKKATKPYAPKMQDENSNTTVAVKSELRVEYENQCHLCFVSCWSGAALVNHLKRHE